MTSTPPDPLKTLTRAVAALGSLLSAAVAGVPLWLVVPLVVVVVIPGAVAWWALLCGHQQQVRAWRSQREGR